MFFSGSHYSPVSWLGKTYRISYQTNVLVFSSGGNAMRRVINSRASVEKRDEASGRLRGQSTRYSKVASFFEHSADSSPRARQRLRWPE
jgi:hypothetical protein